uniref:HNHc domain-containing protein n=1 Tax=Rhabditophanes sp. KR3021 TaxID=114890 RepID=A0AC35TS59_9BILA
MNNGMELQNIENGHYIKITFKVVYLLDGIQRSSKERAAFKPYRHLRPSEYGSAIWLILATAFHGPKSSPPDQVNHINGDILDNRAANLE